MPRIQNHVHKLHKITYKSGNEVYFCVLDCTFKIAPKFALGKRSVCNRCGDEFIMNEYAIRLVKPHCEGCHEAKKISGKMKSGTSPESKEAYSGEQLDGKSPTPLMVSSVRNDHVPLFSFQPPNDEDI